MPIELPNNLNEICEVVQISVRYPRCTRQVEQKTKIVVDDVEVDNENLASPAWRLMPKEMSKDLSKVGTAVAKLIAKYCVHFQATNSQGVSTYCRGVYMTPVHTAEGLLSQLAESDAELKAIVERHTDDMIRFERAIRFQMKDDAAFELARAKIPTREEMLKTTGVWFASFPLAQQSRGVQLGQSRLLGEARRRADEMLDGLTGNLVNQPRAELAEAVASLVRLAVEGGRVTAKTLAPIRRALEKVKLFTFIEDPTTQSQLDALSYRLETTDLRLLDQDQAAIDALRKTSEELLRPSDVRRRRVGVAS